MDLCQLLVPDHPAKAKPDHQAECSGVAAWGVGVRVPGAQSAGHSRSDLDDAGEAQAEWSVHGHGAALDLVSIQA